MILDIERLRKDIIDYYGTAAACCFAPAFLDVSKAENASAEEIIEMAEEAGIDIRKYLC